MSNKTTILIPTKIVSKVSKAFMQKAKASDSISIPLEAQPDLMYMRSILVSTGSNKNDDVFLPSEMWKARATPVFKPVDWEHNTGRELTSDEINQNPGKVVADNQIIGFMYNSFVTDKNGVVLHEGKTSATDFNVPENFHIIDEAIIWKGTFPKTAARLEQGAARNELFVSMEAWFENYDYLVGNKVVARNEETAFLESNLRANGGNGTFGNDSVKRVLRNITFGGKGIVERPANEPSVIQTVTHKPMSAVSSQNKSIASNILSELDSGTRVKITEDSEMAENAKDIMTAAGPSFDDYKAVTQELAEARTENKTQAGELKSIKTERDELKTQTDSLKAALTKGAKVLEEALPGVAEKMAKSDVSELFDVIADAVKASSSQVGEKIKAAEVKAEEAEKKLVELQTQVRANNRVVKIQAELNLNAVEGDNEDAIKAKLSQAQKIAKDTMNLDDEAFASRLDSLKTLLSLAAPKNEKDDSKDKDKMSKDKMDKDKSDASDNGFDLSILDSVKASETIPAGEDNSNVAPELEKAYAGLVESLLNADKQEDKK